MKRRLLSVLDLFLWANPWFIFTFLDNRWLRKDFLNPYFQNRPKWFERYYQWKPAWFSQKAILIVKTDAIGDYLLFRNLIEDISNEFTPKGYQIHLLGNVLWKEMAQQFDAPFVDRFFWLKKGEFNQPLGDQYRIGVLQQLDGMVYESILYPNLSREKRAGDWIVQHVTAQKKIGFRGDLQNQKAEEREAGNTAFQPLVEPQPTTVFEFERNREIVAKLMGKVPAKRKPYLPIQRNTNGNSPYVVLFPGASTPLKQWPVERFVEMAGWIHQTYGIRMVVAGGPEDKVLGDQIASGYPNLVENRAGKTTLLELVDLIGNASLLLTNDTSALHIGAQTGVPVVCIFKCNHFGRFLPYPETQFPHVQICIPQELSKLTFIELATRYSQNYGEPIEDITTAQVMKAIKKSLPA